MIKLFEHNRKAYDAVVAMLAKTGKAAVIHPTGTGKSFIAFKLCEDNPDKTICWLSPSEYIFKTQLENVKASCGYEPENIEFYTYARLMMMSEAEIKDIQPDIIVYDEFHRAGAAQWSLGIKRLRKTYPTAPMLGLSATAVRYLDNNRDLAEELFNGCVASEMSLGEAIVRRILPAPKYVVTAYMYQNEMVRLRERIERASSQATRDVAERYYEALRRALEKADGLDVVFDKHMTERTGKYIVFCANIHAMQDCMSHVLEWFGRLDAEPHVYWFYTLQPDTLSSFEDFKADNDEQHLRLLFCIDALNEGIHVADVDGVILFRPTVSPIIYKQQIGRALSAGKTDTPVIFDVVNNFQGLNSIDSLKEEMRVAVTRYDGFGGREKIVTERFQVIDEVRECRELFNALEDVLAASWETMYVCAEAYWREHGNLDVPMRYKTPEGYSLGAWIQSQRRVRTGKKEGALSEERIAKLDALGMRWGTVSDVSWERHYAACQVYREEYGDLNVPGDYITEDGLALGTWIIAIRNFRRSGSKAPCCTPERLQMLDDLGMIWDAADYSWNRNYEAARAYRVQHGDLEVPHGYIQDGVQLYGWLASLRQMYRCASGRRGSLTAERIAQLDALGMRWELKSDLAWEKGYAEAEAYYKEHGAADAPVTYVAADGYKLGKWLSRCRIKYAKGTLPEERIRRLERINMVWDKSRENDWDECFEMVKDYYLAHGSLSIPRDYVAGGVWLNRWLREQKLILQGKREGKTLTESQRRKLMSISFTIAGEAVSSRQGGRIERQIQRAEALS